MMIQEPMLCTKEASTRYGGLMLCGTNFGLARGDAPKPEAAFEPDADYFTQESHRTGDKFVGGLIRWFRWWNIPLEHDDSCPTELNKAMSQTNLFYDSSASFELRPPDDMNLAYSRLKTSISRLNISGLLVASAKLVDETRNQFSLPKWKMIPSGKFWMGFASTANLHVVVCPHPTSPQSLADVEPLASEMRAWISMVLDEQRGKRAEQ